MAGMEIPPEESQQRLFDRNLSTVRTVWRMQTLVQQIHSGKPWSFAYYFASGESPLTDNSHNARFGLERLREDIAAWLEHQQDEVGLTEIYNAIHNMTGLILLAIQGELANPAAEELAADGYIGTREDLENVLEIFQQMQNSEVEPLGVEA